MIDVAHRCWVNAQSPTLQFHLISWGLLEEFDARASHLINILTIEELDPELIDSVWNLRKIVNLTMLDFNSEALNLDGIASELRRRRGEESVDLFLSAFDKLMKYPRNPKRALLTKLLRNGEAAGKVLLWPRPAGVHPPGWPADAVNAQLRKDFGQDFPSELKWVNYLREDMPEVVDSVVLWNPIKWEGRNLPSEHKLMRPLRRGLAKNTFILLYQVQGVPRVRFGLEMNRVGLRIHGGSERPSKTPINRWIWHEDNSRLESEPDHTEPPRETRDWPPDLHEDDDHRSQDEVVQDAVCIDASGGGRVYVASREIVRSDGSVGETDDLRPGDLVAIPERVGEAGESSRLQRARVANAQWKKALCHALEEGGVDLLLQGFRDYGINTVHAWNLQAWSDMRVLAPRDKGTFFVLLRVLSDLVSIDFSIPSKAESEELWAQILRTRNTQRMEGRRKAFEDMVLLRERLKEQPAQGPGLIEVEESRWRMRVVRVSSISFGSVPYGKLNKYEKVSDGKTNS
jgi:hypothetical protein